MTNGIYYALLTASLTLHCPIINFLPDSLSHSRSSSEMYGWTRTNALAAKMCMPVALTKWSLVSENVGLGV